MCLDIVDGIELAEPAGVSERVLAVLSEVKRIGYCLISYPGFYC